MRPSPAALRGPGAAGTRWRTPRTRSSSPLAASRSTASRTVSQGAGRSSAARPWPSIARRSPATTPSRPRGVSALARMAWARTPGPPATRTPPARSTSARTSRVTPSPQPRAKARSRACSRARAPASTARAATLRARSTARTLAAASTAPARRRLRPLARVPSCWPSSSPIPMAPIVRLSGSSCASRGQTRSISVASRSPTTRWTRSCCRRRSTSRAAVASWSRPPPRPRPDAPTCSGARSVDSR